MMKYIIIMFILLCNSLKLFSASYIDGPTKVDGGAMASYIGFFHESVDFNWNVTWKVTHGRFKHPDIGSTSITQKAGDRIVLIFWDDSNEKGVITASINGILYLRLEVDINSVKDMYITEFSCNGSKVTDGTINLPLGKSGTIECSVPNLEYPITKTKIAYFQWSTPKSWGGGTFTDKGTIKINYDINTGDGETITVTPIGYKGVLGNSKTITIKRKAPPLPPLFDGNIKNVTITSNKTYKHSNLYAENVIIKDGANVVMNGYNSVRIVPGFTAELGSTVRIYNGTATTRASFYANDTIEDKKQLDVNTAKLYQNVPNPANNFVTITCCIPENAANCSIYIYNMMGNLVVETPISFVGQKSIDIDTSKLASGIYIYSLLIDGQLIDSKRMIVNK